MSRRQIVESYLDGQMSRRVFIRRLVATGVATATALSYASVLDADPAAAGLADDYYLIALDDHFRGVEDSDLVKMPARLELGQSFYIRNMGSDGHGVRDLSLGLFDNQDMDFTERTDIIKPPGAGTYRFKCDEQHAGPMAGTIKVPMVLTPTTGPLGTTFSIRWAPSRAPVGFVFDVERKKPGQQNFTAWRSGVTAAGANFRPGARGRYAFRARVRKVGEGQTGWSATQKLRVT